MATSKRKRERPLKGSQKPNIHIAPEYAVSVGKSAGKLAKTCGLTPDKWQLDILCDWFGVDENGEYTSSICGVSVPRQNGKNALLEMRELYGAWALGEKILHTAHEVRSHTSAFNRVASFFEDPANEEIYKCVKCIRRANGQERIELNELDEEGNIIGDGGQIWFSARSRGAMRGQSSFDVIVFDEAQELTHEHLSALVPTQSASESGNTQLILTGTPPEYTCAGTAFQDIRQEIINGKQKDACWHEWSVSEVGDIYDEKRWEATNPALGKRIRRKAIENELTMLSPDGFARERLGMWVEGIQNTIIDRKKWDALEVDINNAPEETETEKTAFGVKFSPDGARVSLGVARLDKGCPAHVELVEERDMTHGMQWLVDGLMGVKGEASCVVIDGKAGAQTLMERLRDAGAPKKFMVAPSTGDVVSAYAGFLADITEEQFTHLKDPALNNAAYNAMKRDIGNAGGFGFTGYGDVDVSPIEAVALALWGVKTTKRNPKRKVVIL